MIRILNKDFIKQPDAVIVCGTCNNCISPVKENDLIFGATVPYKLKTKKIIDLRVIVCKTCDVITSAAISGISEEGDNIIKAEYHGLTIEEYGNIDPVFLDSLTTTVIVNKIGAI